MRERNRAVGEASGPSHAAPRRRGAARRITVVCSLGAILTLLRLPAFAGVGLGVAPTYPGLVQVGTTNVPVGLSIVNTSTTPESGGTLTLMLITHTPSCGMDTPNPCSMANADPGVFLVKGPANGQSGTACHGMTFTIGTPNAVTGEVEFTPSSPVILAPPGTGPMSTCTINFFVDVLKLPTKDAQPAAGLQTNPLGRVRAIAAVNMVEGTGTGAGLVTVVEPTPTPTTTPTTTPTRTPTKFPLEDPCEEDSQCESGFCFDNQCCSSRCLEGQLCIGGQCTDPSPTVTETPTPTTTPTPSITLTPTLTPDANDCCYCDDPVPACAAPSAGRCTLLCASGTPAVPVYDSYCLPGPTPNETETPVGGRCVTSTPTPTITPTRTPPCLGEDLVPNYNFIPGYCGGIQQDCLTEMCPGSPPSGTKGNGLPENRFVCKDDDPTCDVGPPGDRACTWRYSICLNLIDIENRFRCTNRGPVAEVRLTSPVQGKPKGTGQIQSVASFEAALAKLGATVGGFKKRAMIFNPPLATPACTEPIDFVLPLKQNRKSLVYKSTKFRLWYRVYGPSKQFDGDHFFMQCNP